MRANHAIAELLERLADLYELDETPWKPQALRKAASTIKSLADDIGILYAQQGKKGLTLLPGIGSGIADHIIEYLETEHISDIDKLEHKYPGLCALLEIPGLGPKKAKKLARHLHIKSIDDLRHAALEHKIRTIAGFGEKSEQDILDGIAHLERSSGRTLLGIALPHARKILEQLRAHPGVQQADIAGSLRRREETIGDYDFLACGRHPEQIIHWFTTAPFVKKILAQGSTKASTILDTGQNADLRVVSPDEWGSALQYFTGNKDHNVTLRQFAISKGCKLSEYGLFKNDKPLASKTEQDIYHALGLDSIEPELRQNNGEIDAAKNHTLPNLITLPDVRGDLHMHTTQSDGANTISEMIDAGQKIGYEYIGISDHSVSQHIANGLNEKRLHSHIAEIRKCAQHARIRVLAGSEVDILSTGALDYSHETIGKLDYAIASVHAGFKQSTKILTERICNAMKESHVTIIGHPTGRLLKTRPGYDLDWEAILKTAQDTATLLEINAQPSRLDLSAPLVRKAIAHDVKLIINTDAHSTQQLFNMELGVAQARRGWAAKEHIVNTLPFKKFQKYLNKKA